MLRTRPVLLALAPERAPWLTALLDTAPPVEVIPCRSPEEVRVRLAAGGMASALVADARLPALDRDLIAVSDDAGCPVVVVEGARRGRNWRELGAAAVVGAGAGPGDLLDALHAVGRPVPEVRLDSAADLALTLGWPGPTAAIPSGAATLVAVCGPGGTGASTIAMATAEGLARTGGADSGPTVLVDLARRADLALLHGIAPLAASPGLPELVQAHRLGRVAPADVGGFTLALPQRGYRLLPGLRRPQAWATLAPRAMEAALVSVQRACTTLVCDLEPDFEGEREGGSLDVEHRNAPSRTAISRADLVLVVGEPGVKGIHALLRLIGDLRGAGLPEHRLVAVVNRSSRCRRVKTEVEAALGHRPDAAAAIGPLLLPSYPPRWLAGHPAPLPPALWAPLAVTVHRALAACGPRGSGAPSPRVLAPGSLGHLTGSPDPGQ